MSEVIIKINREKGFDYLVDKNGNIIKRKYSWIKDRWTVVFIVILILAGLYYLQISQMKTTEKNFEPMCLEYMNLRSQWILEHPGEIPTLEEVFSIKVNKFQNPNE